jgi:hypothetical protein
VIGEGDAVGVPCEVVQHVGGAAKGRLRVDHPRLVMERSEPRANADSGASACKAPGNDRRPSRNDVRRPATSFPRKTCRRTFTGRKKVGRAWIHRASSGDSPPAGTTQWTCG